MKQKTMIFKPRKILNHNIYIVSEYLTGILQMDAGRAEEKGMRKTSVLSIENSVK